MKIAGIVFSTIAIAFFATVSFADDHAAKACHGKDGKKVETAKDEAACKKAGGEWK